MRFLLVEDDVFIQNAFQRLFRRHYAGVTVTITDSANIAVMVLAQGEVEGEPFDVIISDYNIAVGTGGDILEWVRVHLSRLEERFLFISSDDRAEAMHRHFIRKPSRTNHILAAIDSLLQPALTGKECH